MVVIFLIVLLIFGAAKLPEVGKGLEKVIRELKKAGKEIKNDLEETTKYEEEKKKTPCSES